MSPKQSLRRLSEKEIEDAMIPLCLSPDFENFIEAVRRMKDYSVQAYIHTDTIKSERESLAVRGEIRAYSWIIETFEANRQQLEARAQSIEEQQQG